MGLRQRERPQRSREWFVREIVGVASIGQGCEVDVTASRESLLQEECGSSARGVAIHEQHECGCECEHAFLAVGGMGSEQGHGGYAELGQAHDAPGTLDDYQATGESGSNPMESEEDLVSRERGRQLPLAVDGDGVGIEAAAGVAEGSAVGVVEPDCDAAAEEATAVIGAGLESPSGLGADAFVLQPG